jgi:hypothetical protein
MLMSAKAKAATDDDKKFLAAAAQSDQNEIKLSELAEQKATNPAVKVLRPEDGDGAYQDVGEHEAVRGIMGIDASGRSR